MRSPLLIVSRIHQQIIYNSKCCKMTKLNVVCDKNYRTHTDKKHNNLKASRLYVGVMFLPVTHISQGVALLKVDHSQLFSSPPKTWVERPSVLQFPTIAPQSLIMHHIIQYSAYYNTIYNCNDLYKNQWISCYYSC